MKKRKQVKYGEPGYRHPYMEYEGTRMWRWVSKGLRDLVNNQDLVEIDDRRYIVIANGQKRRRASPRLRHTEK